MGDAESLHRIQSDPVHMRFYPHPFSVKETEDWIAWTRDNYVRNGFGLLAVEDLATGEFRGNVGPVLQHVEGVDEIELGWSITPARHLGMTIWKQTIFGSLPQLHRSVEGEQAS
jgi:RimJ/RimL family protein N-acetyltransferase